MVSVELLESQHPQQQLDLATWDRTLGSKGKENFSNDSDTGVLCNIHSCNQIEYCKLGNDCAHSGSFVKEVPILLEVLHNGVVQPGIPLAVEDGEILQQHSWSVTWQSQGYTILAAGDHLQILIRNM